jgi:hypothetical protein
MREAGVPSTWSVTALAEYARPTGDSYGRTTNAPAQRFDGANLRATLEVG